MSVKCKACSKSIYPMDPQINLDGVKFHKACAKCGDCGCQITISNFTKNESNDQTVLLCKIHYFKRFHEGGSYLGGEKFRVKAARDVTGSSPLPPAASEPVVSKEEEEPAAHKSFYSLPTKKVSQSPVNAPAEEVAPRAVETSPATVFTAVESVAKEEPAREPASEVGDSTSAPTTEEEAPAAADESVPAVEQLTLDTETVSADTVGEGVETSTD